ncbi:hypothetical protein M9H77_16227 [Catharanthus roseus]|uniref:Uncharacterized protein n=1 Tax=Catharanthus roseus TaxID=4058 RepID=A0ACC0B0V9_CATRO|nr:hypothetical protein M9H77_16227 [Catharanthus roseus]
MALVVVDKAKEEKEPRDPPPAPLIVECTMADCVRLSIIGMRLSITRPAVDANNFKIMPNIIQMENKSTPFEKSQNSEGEEKNTSNPKKKGLMAWVPIQLKEKGRTTTSQILMIQEDDSDANDFSPIMRVISGLIGNTVSLVFLLYSWTYSDILRLKVQKRKRKRIIKRRLRAFDEEFDESDSSIQATFERMKIRQTQHSDALAGIQDTLWFQELMLNRIHGRLFLEEGRGGGGGGGGESG